MNGDDDAADNLTPEDRATIAAHPIEAFANPAPDTAGDDAPGAALLRREVAGLHRLVRRLYEQIPRPVASSTITAVVVKITGNAAGGGKYNGRILTGASTAVATGTLAMPEGMTVPGADNALVLNDYENGSSGHLLPVNSYYNGSVVAQGATSIVVITAPGPGVVPVTLVQTGGGNGSGTTAATYTYTLKDAAGTTLATAVAPDWPRPKGFMVAATAGLGYPSGGTWKLAVAYEYPDTDSDCST